MSDVIVVSAFETRLGTLTTPYVKTLNKRPPSLPQTYTSLERDFAVVERVTIGGSPNSQFRETGTLTVVVNVRSGVGVDQADTVAEEVRNLFHNFSTGHLQVMKVDSPVVFDPDDGSYFQLRIPVQYQFDFFK